VFVAENARTEASRAAGAGVLDAADG
jgi:hypothetical protein